MLILIWKTGRIGKDCIGTPKLLGTRIHGCYEILYRTADMLGYLQGNIIGGCDHNGVETLFHGEYFVQLCGDIGSSVCYAGYAGSGHGDLVIQT